MTRWDEILTLPVQNPPSLEFSSDDVVWTRVEGWQDGVDRVALIPFSRVNDFVRGESNKKECPTKFHVEARRRRPPDMAYKPKVDGILEYILYWCSFGPDDHRKGGTVRPSRTYSLKRKTPAGRPSTKRGCVCHFIVKRLIAEPSVALVIYNFEKHIDKQGLPCHGPQDKMSVGTRAMFAPYISEELRLQVTSLLHVGIPVETIMQRHTESVEKQGGPCNRDDLLTHRYVRRLERKIRRSTYELDPDDATSISLWTETHQGDVFFYKDFSDTEPFVLGIQTEWQLQQLIRFGNGSLLALDSKFGSNKLKYPVQSLLVFDLKNNAIPVAWIITPAFSSNDIYRWLRGLHDRVYSKDPTWRLGGFIIDDPSSDVHLIREVFHCSVSISSWRVRHAWHKNLIRKCTDTGSRVEIFACLGKILEEICTRNGDIEAFNNFMEDFIDCTDFVDYFRSTWFPRLASWTDALKALPLATLEISSAIECYHHQMKLRLLNEKEPSVYQRADWLVNKLGTKVHSHYWLDGYAGKDNFSRYWKVEWRSGSTAWHQALKISDMDIVVGTESAQVVSKKNQGKVHTVWNPGCEFSICECNWSSMGNLCKHAIKLSRYYRGRALSAQSISFCQYGQILNNILHCSPHDSIIRDHSIALVLSVQMQQAALLNVQRAQLPTSMSSPVGNDLVANEGLPTSCGAENDNESLLRQNLSANEIDIAVETPATEIEIAAETPAVVGLPHSKLTDKRELTSTNEDLCENHSLAGRTDSRIQIDRRDHAADSTPTAGSLEKGKINNRVVVADLENKAADHANESQVSGAFNHEFAVPLTNVSVEDLSDELVVTSTNKSSSCNDAVMTSIYEKNMDIDPESIKNCLSSSSISDRSIEGETDNSGKPLPLLCQMKPNDCAEISDMVVPDTVGVVDGARNNTVRNGTSNRHCCESGTATNHNFGGNVTIEVSNAGKNCRNHEMEQDSPALDFDHVKPVHDSDGFAKDVCEKVPAGANVKEPADSNQLMNDCKDGKIKVAKETRKRGFTDN